jgi:hypothetical protein
VCHCPTVFASPFSEFHCNISLQVEKKRKLSMKFRDFWNVAPCTHIQVDR